MTELQTIQDKIDKMRSSSLLVRIQAVSIQGVLVRTSASELDMATEFVFEDADPVRFRKFYYNVRRSIGSRVSVSMGGVTFSAVIGDCTKLPANFQPEDYVNEVFEITFEFPKKQAKAESVASGYICIPVPQIKRVWREVPEYPHITIGYMPEVTHAQAQDIASRVYQVVNQYDSFAVELVGRELFGTKHVALVKPSPALRALHAAIIQKVHSKYPGVIDLKTHPRWRPHVTIGEEPVKFNTNCSIEVDTVNVNVKNGAEYEIRMKRS